MMNIAVTTDALRNVLDEARKQFISVSINDWQGLIPNQYFTIAALDELNVGVKNVIIVLLTSDVNAQPLSIDTTSIKDIKFNKYLNLNGRLVNGVHIVTTKASSTTLSD
jgi:hypothetical protein